MAWESSVVEDKAAVGQEQARNQRLKKLDDQLYAQLSAPRKPASKGGKGGSLANSSLPPRKQQSSALWIKEQGVARVLSAKGSYLQTMGFTEKGHVYLQAEEMAVLQERGLILQKSESREEERSLDFPYHQLKASGLSFMYFQVYGLLRRLGFVVYRQNQALSERKKPRTPIDPPIPPSNLPPCSRILGWIGWMVYPCIRLLVWPLTALRTWLIPGTLGPHLHVWKPKGTFSKRDPGPPAFTLSIHPADTPMYELLRPQASGSRGTDDAPSSTKPISSLMAMTDMSGEMTFVHTSPVPSPTSGACRRVAKRGSISLALSSSSSSSSPLPVDQGVKGEA
ncbi:MAG: hypothetical protein DHS80DRAFT_22822 [Piptocephalis tieghemiana]|nr:MAG: hypothetical protein DHS80DRAFT_22822 [Piptocephalis tieghemiana]